ncbi:Putative ubiquitin-like-specific protease 1B [Arachis hypogaea]|nr:Putative ubiquitin-like-specific protease 1B [Arachis hypogaea]
MRCSPCYINNLFTHLERHNEQAKLAEIEAIGFGYLRRVLQWHVKQSIMLQLAEAYDVERNTLMVNAGDIRISAELIGNVFGIPSRDKTTSQPSYKEAEKESKTGSRRKVLVHRSRSRRRTKKAIPRENDRGSNAAPFVFPDSNDDDNVSLARRIRLFQQHPPAHDVRQADPVFKENHEMNLTSRSFSVLNLSKYSTMLNKGRETKAIIMQPLQTVLPNKSTYHTLSPDLASYEGRDYMVLQRKDFWTLKPHSWVNSCVIQWMCYSFNDTESSRFKREFYCVCPGILESVIRNASLESFMDGVTPIYDGLSPSFGDDTRFFDKVVAAKRKWWLISYHWRGHWWVYAFEVIAKRILILDSLHSAPEDDKRDKLDAYVRLCEDMASISIPAFVRTTHGPARSYARVLKQPNNFDCGMCVIKFMESWTEDRELYEWDEDSLGSDRMELMLDIICSPHNALVHQLISSLEDKVKPIRCNAPRNKKKEVSSPYTAPSMRSLIERAEGLPKGAMRKGRKRLLT